MNTNYEPKKKNKNSVKQFLSKYIYVIALALVLILGTSYSLIFFIQNRKIDDGSISVGGLTANLSNNAINATNLTASNDSDGIGLFTKSLTINNTSTNNGNVKVSITRTSGLELTDLRYGLFINDVLMEISDVPLNGLIYESAILANETINVELRLWPKSTYSGNVTTFVGTLDSDITYGGLLATEYIALLSETDNKITKTGDDYTYASDSTNNYVKFNCDNGTCETWRIVGIKNDRLVLTSNNNYSGASSRTYSEIYDATLTYNDDTDLVFSHSTDKNNVYLIKTAKIIEGSGTTTNPYVLGYDLLSTDDNKAIATLTYNNSGATTNQPIYYGRTNYISQTVNDSSFLGWTDGTNTYNLGDTINFISNTTLQSEYSVGNNRNVMNTFSSTITSQKNKITKIIFQSEQQSDIDSKYNAASIKDDITYNNQGSVKAWLSDDGKGNNTYIMYVESYGKTYLTTANELFKDFTELTEINFLNVNTSEVSDMSSTFENCVKLDNLDLSSFNTGRVNLFNNTFYNCKKLKNLNINSFDVKNVTSFYQMFSGCNELVSLNLNHFVTTSAVVFSRMFENCSSLSTLKIDNFVTTNATGMVAMFFGCSSLTSLDLSHFDTKKVEEFWAMFSGCTNLVTLDISSFEGDGVTNGTAEMFYDCSKLLELDLRNFSIPNAVETNAMFFNCSSLKTILFDVFDATNVQNMNSMFEGCSSLTTLDMSNFIAKSVVLMQNVFKDCSKLVSLNLSKIETNNTTTMLSLFYGCSELTSVLIPKFRTNNCNVLQWMFYGCSKLASVNLTNFVIKRNASLFGMFGDCTSLTELDLSSFEIDNNNTLKQMFNGCTNIRTIYVSNLWNVTEYSNSDYMFASCYQLVGQAGTSFSWDNLNGDYARVDGGQSNPGYFTLKTV